MFNIKETIDLFSFEIELKSGEKIESDHLSPSLDKLINQDTLKVSITIDGTDPTPFIINNQDDFKNIFTLNDDIEDDSDTLIKFEIIKNNKNSINIYNLEYFTKYLKDLSLIQILNVFSKLNNTDSTKIIMIFSEFKNVNFSTNLFCTKKSAKEINSQDKKDRIENLNLVSNTSGISNFNFLPEDFRVYDSSENLLELKFIFDKISILLSIIFISDWSEINNNDFHFKILGYKKIDITIPYIHSINNPDVYFKIYKWIYESGNGNIEDKLGLARNIISRFIKHNTQELILDEDAYSSILTSYKIYLKENVEKYIETKNKVAELTTELSIKISDMNHFIVNNFKTNNFTIVSFFISLFIFNSVSFKQTTIFTKHTFAISLIVLIISRLYLHLTSVQLKKDIAFNKKYFYKVKSIYKDLFDETELDNLFCIQFFTESTEEVKNSFKTYQNIWFLEIYLILLLSILITFSSAIKFAISFYINLF